MWVSLVEKCSYVQQAPRIGLLMIRLVAFGLGVAHFWQLYVQPGYTWTGALQKDPEHDHLGTSNWIELLFVRMYILSFVLFVVWLVWFTLTIWSAVCFVAMTVSLILGGLSVYAELMKWWPELVSLFSFAMLGDCSGSLSSQRDHFWKRILCFVS